MRRATCGLALLCLSACATVEPVGTQPVTLRVVDDTNYKLGSQQQAAVGDAVIKVRRYTVEEREVASVRANADCRVLGGGYDTRFVKGQILTVEGRRPSADGGFWVVPVQTSQMGIPASLSLQVDAEGRIQPKAIGGGVAYTYKAEPADCRLLPVRSTEVVDARPYENYEIIFNGSDGQAMKFTYREFSPTDLARTAFYQELSYPVGSKSVRFRKILFDVVELSPQYLTYVVRADQ